MKKHRATARDVEGERSDRIKPEHRRMFARACNMMNNCLEEVREYIPESEYYLASDTLHLMTGPSHEGYRAKKHPERIALSCLMPGMDGGDW
jgi:hypothetical protein